MRSFVLFICLSLVLFACGSGNGGDSPEYKLRSLEHLETVYYNLYDNFTVDEGDGEGDGDIIDFVGILWDRLIKSGFQKTDISMYLPTLGGIDPMSPNYGKDGYRLQVKIASGRFYICDLNGIYRDYDGDGFSGK